MDGVRWVIVAATAIVAALPVSSRAQGFPPDRPLVARDFMVGTVFERWKGTTDADGRGEMRSHVDLPAATPYPAVVLSVTSMMADAAGGHLEYGFGTEPTCTGTVPAKARCTGFDIVVHTAPGTTIRSFGLTYQVMNILADEVTSPTPGTGRIP